MQQIKDFCFLPRKPLKTQILKFPLSLDSPPSCWRNDDQPSGKLITGKNIVVHKLAPAAVGHICV